MRLAGYQTTTQRNAAFEQMLEENEILAESFAQATAALLSLRSEDEGWLPLNRLNEEDGFTLENLQQIASYADLQATGNPLLKRGFTARRDNIYGRGVIFEEVPDKKVSQRIKGILEKPINVKVLFSNEAFEKHEREAYTAGNGFVAYDRDAEEFFDIPFSEVSNFASNPRSSDDVWYYQRTFTEVDPVTNRPKDQPTVEWYPVLERFESAGRKNPLSKTIADKPVKTNIIVIDYKVNKAVGKTWGVPDCLAAMPYAWAHAEYIRDASKLLKAMQLIAWKYVAKTKSNAVNASAQMRLPKNVASTASMSNGDLTPVKSAGQVDMKDGDTIAAYVASALELSLTDILPDGSRSSGFGTVAALSSATVSATRNRQALWSDFFRRVYRAVGAKAIEVNWPPIQEDPVYRIAQTLQIGHASGALHQDEYREAYLELTKVPKLHEGVPEATIFTNAAQYSAEAIAKEQNAAADEAARAAGNVQGVGRSNGVGASAGNNDLRDMGHQPGSG